ncbi:MAG: lyase family protein, partial [Microbacteriaceae bacterium]
MPSEPAGPSELAGPAAPAALDAGLLQPVSAGHDAPVSDAAVLDALVAAEIALVRAFAALGVAPADVAEGLSARFGWRGPGAGCHGHGLDPAALAAAGVAGGNPVIPLAAALRRAAPEPLRPWLHRGATSQDILDSALMLVAHGASARVLRELDAAAADLDALAAARRDQPAAARTLGQQAVPTTVGLRAAGWLAGVDRARARLAA